MILLSSNAWLSSIMVVEETKTDSTRLVIVGLLAPFKTLEDAQWWKLRWKIQMGKQWSAEPGRTQNLVNVPKDTSALIFLSSASAARRITKIFTTKMLLLDVVPPNFLQWISRPAVSRWTFLESLVQMISVRQIPNAKIKKFSLIVVTNDLQYSPQYRQNWIF